MSGLLARSIGRNDSSGLNLGKVNQTTFSWSCLYICMIGSAVPEMARAQSGAGVGLRAEEILRVPPSVLVSRQSFGDINCRVPSEGVRVADEIEGIAIRSVRLVDAPSVVSASAIEREVAGLIGATVAREALGRAVERIECLYRERGFIFAQAEILRESEDGAFGVRLREGRVASVEVSTPSANAASFVLRAFAGVQRGAPLNANDVRFGLAQAAAMGVDNVRPTIRRNRNDPDAIDLILVVEPPGHDAFLATQNFNIQSIGSWGLSAGVRLRGLTPLFETTTLAVYSTPDFSEQRSVQASSEALLTGTGLRVQVDLAYGQTQPDGPFEPLDVDARSGISRLQLSHPVLVRRGVIASGYGGMEFVDQTTRFLGDVLNNDDSLRVASLGLRADAASRRIVFNGDVEVRRGVDLLGASEEGDRSLSRANGDPQSWVFRLDTRAAVQLPKRFVAQARVRGQYSDRPLLAYEEFAFGQLTGGRGFDPAAITGDRGLMVSGEITQAGFKVPGLPERFGVSVQPYVFADAARAWNVEPGAPDTFSDGISGGVGLRANLARRAQLDVAWANPLGNPRGIGPDQAGPRLLISFSTSLDFTFRDGFFARGRK